MRSALSVESLNSHGALVVEARSSSKPSKERKREGRSARYSQPGLGSRGGQGVRFVSGGIARGPHPSQAARCRAHALPREEQRVGRFVEEVDVDQVDPLRRADVHVDHACGRQASGGFACARARGRERVSVRARARLRMRASV